MVYFSYFPSQVLQCRGDAEFLSSLISTHAKTVCLNNPYLVINLIYHYQIYFSNLATLHDRHPAVMYAMS